MALLAVRNHAPRPFVPAVPRWYVYQKTTALADAITEKKLFLISPFFELVFLVNCTARYSRHQVGVATIISRAQKIVHKRSVSRSDSGKSRAWLCSTYGSYSSVHHTSIIRPHKPVFLKSGPSWGRRLMEAALEQRRQVALKGCYLLWYSIVFGSVLTPRLADM